MAEKNRDNIWNLQFGRRKKGECIPPRAFSRDGYLINQGIISDVRYGRRTTRETGCGWIACYNFLHYMGRDEDPLAVAHEMERMLLWGGFRGSHPLTLWIFLRRRGSRFRIAFTRWGTERILRRWNRQNDHGRKAAGIIAYRHRSGSHFAAFVKQAEDDRYRFLNVIYGRENTLWTVKEFFRERVTFPICFTLLWREPESGSWAYQEPESERSRTPYSSGR